MLSGDQMAIARAPPFIAANTIFQSRKGSVDEK
jgi:hypothetical protein